MSGTYEGTILITGATGTVGTEVVKALSAKGCSVSAAVHSMGKAEKIKGPGVEIVELDYAQPVTIESAFHSVEKLFMLTLFSPDMVNVSAQLISNASNFGVKHIVKLSVMGADA